MSTFQLSRSHLSVATSAQPYAHRLFAGRCRARSTRRNRLPLLRRSAHPVVVNVSSGVGWPRYLSTEGHDEFHVATIPYATSKAAVIALTVQYAKNLPSFRVNVSDPGYTATDFNSHGGPQTVTEGTDATVALALVAADGPTVEFHDRHGRIEY